MLGSGSCVHVLCGDFNFCLSYTVLIKETNFITLQAERSVKAFHLHILKVRGTLEKRPQALFILLCLLHWPFFLSPHMQTDTYTYRHIIINGLKKNNNNSKLFSVLIPKFILKIML